MYRVHARVCLSEIQVPMPQQVSKTTPVSLSIHGLSTFHFSKRIWKAVRCNACPIQEHTHPHSLTGEANVRRQKDNMVANPTSSIYLFLSLLVLPPISACLFLFAHLWFPACPCFLSLSLSLYSSLWMMGNQPGSPFTISHLSIYPSIHPSIPGMCFLFFLSYS